MVEREFPLLSPNPCSLPSITGSQQRPGHSLSSGFSIFLKSALYSGRAWVR